MTAGATDDTDRAVARLGELLSRQGRTIGIAESLTGGLLVQALARQQGSGDWLRGGVVAYQRSVKHGTVWLGVDVGGGPETELLDLDLDEPTEICRAAVDAAIGLALRALDQSDA